MRKLLLVLALLALVVGLTVALSTAALADPIEVRGQVLKGINSFEDAGLALTLGQPDRINLWVDVGGLYTGERDHFGLWTGMSTKTALAEKMTLGLANRLSLGYAWREREVRFLFARDFGDK